MSKNARTLGALHTHTQTIGYVYQNRLTKFNLVLVCNKKYIEKYNQENIDKNMLSWFFVV